MMMNKQIFDLKNAIKKLLHKLVINYKIGAIEVFYESFLSIKVSNL